MYPADLTERGIWTYFAYQYRRSEIEIPFYFRRLLFDGFSLQECWLWVKWKCHHRLSRGCSGGSSLTQTNVSLQFSLLRLRDDESWNPAERAHGDWRVNEHLTRCQSVRLWQPYTLPTVLFTSHNHFKSVSYTWDCHTCCQQVAYNKKKKLKWQTVAPKDICFT